jgi:hypothetical protein
MYVSGSFIVEPSERYRNVLRVVSQILMKCGIQLLFTLGPCFVTATSFWHIFIYSHYRIV